MGFLISPPISLPWALNSPGSPLPGPFCFSPLPICCHHLQTTVSSRVGIVSASPSPPAQHPAQWSAAPLFRAIRHSAVPPRCWAGHQESAARKWSTPSPPSAPLASRSREGWGCQGPARDLGLLSFMTTPVSRNGKDRRFRRPVNVTVMDFSLAPAGPRLFSLLLLWLESEWPGTRTRRTERRRVP